MALGRPAALGQAPEWRDRRTRRGRGSLDACRGRLDNFDAKGGAVADVIACYRQSQRNGKSSAAALARFLESVGKAHAGASTPQPFSIAAHSLGVHCLQMLLEAGLGARLPVARNIALLASCVPQRKHEQWIRQLPRSDALMITTNISDWVLLGALWADKFQAKLGASVPVPPLVVDPKTRYVDFCFGEHEYFVPRCRPARRVQALLPVCRRHPRRLGSVRRLPPVAAATVCWSV